MKNVIVVGGGAAGMMAAIFAADNANVTLIERNEKLGKKVYITGKGRCNVTNTKDTTEFFDEVVSNQKFLYSAIYGFDSSFVYEFFENNGCKLKVERGGRVFPLSDHSSDIIKTLENVLITKKVKILKNTFVKDILVNDNKCNGVILKDGQKLKSDSVIIATGGKSYAVTGSDGNFHNVLKGYNHRITKMVPGLVPFNILEDDCSRMQGLSLKNVSLKLKINEKIIHEGFGEMLFTHFGISGPLVLSASSIYNKRYKDKTCKVIIDLKPALSFEQLDKRLIREFEEKKNKHFKNALDGLLPSKLIPVIIERCGIEEEKPVNSITKEQRQSLAHILKNYELSIASTREFNEAIITIGGIDVKDINPSTMESKIINNLYFAGEMIDVDAFTGGYNLQIAWSTGKLAGENAAL